MSIVYNYAVYGIDDRMWWEIMIDAHSYTGTIMKITKETLPGKITHY